MKRDGKRGLEHSHTQRSQYRLRKRVDQCSSLVLDPSAYADGTDLIGAGRDVRIHVHGVAVTDSSRGLSPDSSGRYPRSQALNDGQPALAGDRAFNSFPMDLENRRIEGRTPSV
jgi:hypothetical protein